ncbi:hypothetical protein DUNSADRAFT_13648 [Dunaliella salina]|uniref:Core-binding (CB) domain-containing protein n=1 Tax=Dunaliella salina TaxID=3046 RepID=A0ABQ7G8W8_DUNSA|nr:hypothetical protein DUNSADRAFT_13648 [Dunaliella salina]|eukprot:KAF5831061.1 hypothetical protein DUNSADRAFT_13648 [Dunaliella salina]
MELPPVDFNAGFSLINACLRGEIALPPPGSFPPQNPAGAAVNAGCPAIQQDSYAHAASQRRQTERLQNIFHERDRDLHEDEEFEAQLAQSALSEEEARKVFATSQSLRASGTQQSYKSAFKKFQDFCGRHNFICYDSPHTVDVAVRFFVDLLEHFKERVDNGMSVPAQSTVRGYQSALQNFYTSANLMVNPAYKAAYHNALKYLQDLEKPPQQDPQTSTPQDALSPDQVKAMLTNASKERSAYGLQTR